MPPTRILLLAPLLVAAAPAQGPEPAALITAAERELKDEQPEHAVLLLWRAQAALDPADDSSATRILQTSAQSLLERADPLHRQRAEARTAIAGEVVSLARAYVRKKWFRTARDLLETTAAYDRAAADKVLPYVDKQIAKLPKPEEPEVEEEPPAQADLLAEFQPFTKHGAWLLKDGSLISPAIEERTPFLLTKVHQHTDNRLAVDVRIGDKQGSAALAFGVVGSGDYLFLELYHTGVRNLTMLSLYGYDADEGQKAKHLAGVDLIMKADERAEFVTIEVLVHGAEVEIRANGRGKVKATLPSPPRGGLGLLIPGNSENKDPVEFRNLRIEPLPVDDRVEEEILPPGPEQTFLDATAAAEERIADGEVEDALRELRVVRRGLAAVESDAIRASIDASIDALLAEHDPCAKARGQAQVAIAELHAGLAEGYREATRLLCARHELRAAAAMHADTAREPLESLEEELKPVLEKELGLPPEPDEQVDDAELIATFAEGRQYWAMGTWSFEPGAVVAPKVQDGGALVLAPQDTGPTRAARVQFRILEGEGGAGLVFAARSPNDFWVAMVAHGAEGSSLVVTRWFGDEWGQGHHETLKFSKAARESFLTLSVELLDGNVRVRAGNTEPYDLKIDAAPGGRFGLLATSDPNKALKVAFRNFRSLDDRAAKKD